MLCLCLIKGSGLNDGQWHTLELNSGQGHLSITVDKDEGATAQTSIPLPLTADTQIFFGGKNSYIFLSVRLSEVNSLYGRKR